MVSRSLIRFMLLGCLTAFAVAGIGTPPENWQSVGIGGGGGLYYPTFNPSNNQDLFVSTDMGALFHSTNLATTWNTVSFLQAFAARQSNIRIAKDGIMYAINESANQKRPMKSIDGGYTWQLLISGGVPSETWALFVDPNNSNRLILGSYTALYYSSNGGTSWTQKFTASPSCWLGGVFFDGNNIYVGTNQGLLVSTNNGSTFSLVTVAPITGGEDYIAFTGAKQGGVVRFLAATVPDGSLNPGDSLGYYYAATNPIKIYRINWGTDIAWTELTNSLNPSDWRFYFAGMAVDNITTMYLAGGSKSSQLPIIVKSVNGGNTWFSTLTTTSNGNVYTGWTGYGGDKGGWGYGGTPVGFSVNVGNPNEAGFTDYGFLHITYDGGKTWRAAYVSPSDLNPPGGSVPQKKAYHGNGLEDTSCWGLTWFDRNNIWADFTDISGIRSTDRGSTWSFNYTGYNYNTSYKSVKHPSNGKMYIATSSVHDMYQSTYLGDSVDSGSGEIMYSSDTGKTWTTLHNFGHPVIDICLDPNDSNTMYASVIDSASGGIFVTHNLNLNASATWTKLANPPRTQGHPFNVKVLNDGTIVCTYSARNPGSGFTDSSGVFMMLSGSTTWIDRTNIYMHYWTKDITISPANQNTWYVGVWSGWGGPFDTNNSAGGLYRTTDRGLNWSKIFSFSSGGLYPRVTGCYINPSNADEAYVTTENDGLWYTTNLTNTAPTFTQVTSYPFHQPERVFFNPYNLNEVWVTSFGNGIRIGTSQTTDVECSLWAAY